MESITITMRGKDGREEERNERERGGGAKSAQLSQRLRLLQNPVQGGGSEMEELSLQETIFPLRLLTEPLATIKREC